MPSRRALFAAIVAIALQGCSKDKGAKREPPRDEPSSKPPAAKLVELVEVGGETGALAQRVTALALVVVKADGSVAIAPAPAPADRRADLDLASVVPGGAVPLDKLAAEAEAVQRRVAKDRGISDDEEAPPPEEDDEDSTGGTGYTDGFDTGKMGKQDSDRAEGQYKMKHDEPPQLAKEHALDEARRAGILGTDDTDPCGAFASLVGTEELSASSGDDGAPGELRGNDPGEMAGGFGFGHVPSGESGWGTIGSSRYLGVYPAGLRGAALRTKLFCGHDTPLVLADARTPAAKLVEVLEALPASQLGVTTDGGAHVRVLPIAFTFVAGNRPAGDDLELGFTIGQAGIRGAAFRGATADETVWTWSGDAAGVVDAFHQGQAKDDLIGRTFVRVRLDADVTASALLDLIAHLLEANATGVAIGEPSIYEAPNHASGYVVGGGRRGAPIPGMRIGQPVFTGDLDKAIIRRYLKRNKPKLLACYEPMLVDHPDLQGTVDTRWRILGDGTVADAHAEGVDPKLSSCVAGVIGAIQFPEPRGEPPVITSYPFQFSPSGG